MATQNDGQIVKRYTGGPEAGELHRICRLGLGMGSSYNPNLVLSHRGLFHTGTTQYPSGGGGQYIPLSHEGVDVGRLLAQRQMKLRLRLPEEWYRAVSVSDTLRQMHVYFMETKGASAGSEQQQELEDRHCLDCVNQGWPSATAGAHAAAMANHMKMAVRVVGARSFRGGMRRQHGGRGRCAGCVGKGPNHTTWEQWGCSWSTGRHRWCGRTAPGADGC